MRIGYSTYNATLDTTTSRAYRLNAYSDERMAKTLDLNIGSLYEILRYNAEHELRFFRLAPDFIPFAGSSVLTLNWPAAFAAHLLTAGNVVRQGDHRLYVFIPNLLINSPRASVIRSSTAELEAYTALLDGMYLDGSHRIALSIGGVFGDRKKSMRRFVENFNALDGRVRRRLALINDDDYSVRECLRVHKETGLPVVFDTFWHRNYPMGEAFIDMFIQAQHTWTAETGAPIVNYLPEMGSDPRDKEVKPNDIFAGDFLAFFQQVRGFQFDLLVETTGYEHAALRARQLAGALRTA